MTGAHALHGFQLRNTAAERLEILVDQHLSLARRGRGTARAVPPVQLLVSAAAGGRPRMLVFRSELFTFAAAHIEGAFPPYRRVIPAVDTLGGLCVVSARELADALASVARAKDHAILEFKDSLQVTNQQKDEQPLLRFNVREASIYGAPSRVLVNPNLMQPAIAAAAGDDRAFIGLAYQPQDVTGPLVVARWLASERPRDRREALTRIHEEVRGENLAVIMPMRQ